MLHGSAAARRLTGPGPSGSRGVGCDVGPSTCLRADAARPAPGGFGLKPASPRDDSDDRLDRLIAQLPPRARAALNWLRKPSSRWVRLPAGVLLILGSLLSILPIFGIWMLPAGLLLLAEDVPPLRRLNDRLLLWLERRRPGWFATSERR
jgi:hypothetical protein